MLTDISDRLTPSVPIEETFAAQPVATGTKISVIFAHKAAAGATIPDYAILSVVNLGDPVAAKAEVDAVAGAGSQAGLMAAAFVNANAAKGGPNFPVFKIIMLPNAEASFGPNGEALTAAQQIRADMLVSCYPAGDATNRNKLKVLAALISGPDRDLQGQFGSFVTVGSIDSLATAQAYAINSQYIIVAFMPDSNSALVSSDADTTTGSPTLLNIDTTGIYSGASVTGAGIPGNTVVLEVFAASILLSANATATAADVTLAFQNQVSQAPEIIAAAHAGALMASAFPYNPVQGVVVGGLVPPQKFSDRIQIDPNGSSEAALVAGMSPLYTQVGGSVALIRSRTTWNLLPDGVTAKTAYFDWQDLVTINDFREDVYQLSQNPPFNNNPGGTKASVNTAALFKDEVIAEMQLYEDLGAFQGVKSLAKLVQVAPSATSRGRFDVKIPINVLPGLYVIAVNIQATTLFDFTI